jgi:hypothetical protein
MFPKQYIKYGNSCDTTKVAMQQQRVKKRKVSFLTTTLDVNFWHSLGKSSSPIRKKISDATKKSSSFCYLFVYLLHFLCWLSFLSFPVLMKYLQDMKTSDLHYSTLNNDDITWSAIFNWRVFPVDNKLSYKWDISVKYKDYIGEDSSEEGLFVSRSKVISFIKMHLLRGNYCKDFISSEYFSDYDNILFRALLHVLKNSACGNFANKIRAFVESIPGVQRAEVSVSLDQRIKIWIEERKPAFILRLPTKERRFALLDNDGYVIKYDIKGEKFLAENVVPLFFVLNGSEKDFQRIFAANLEDEGVLNHSSFSRYKLRCLVVREIYDVLSKLNIYSRVVLISLVGHRRFDVFIDNNSVIKLPDVKRGVMEDVVHLLNTRLANRIARGNFKVIDLRLFPDKLYIG